MKPTGRPPILTNRILEEVTKAGQDGIDSKQIFDNIARDITAQSIRSTLSRLVTGGLVFSDNNNPRRYFARNEWAEVSPKREPVRRRTWWDKFSPEFGQAVEAMVYEAGSVGIDIDSVVEKTGRHVHTVQAVMSGLRRDGKSFTGRSLNEYRYFSKQEWADDYSHSRKPKKRVYAKTPRKPREKKPNTAIEIMPKRLGTTAVVADKKVSWASEVATISADVKITVEKTPRGRFEPTGEESYFSSLQIGNYKPSDSAISRAYG
jgi:hypothetical protein